ncbi:hemerythrin domain-containing protein [Janthinobacterium agaricidamnosum]|uniref:Hemerythrin HHE cation binding domain protein n=1 Tax=Janthinobacterium agaricidamnosum NBRC 102515 = DSM 9628 TaxID=1349767 RepID=W0UZQ3_9BURK|nr:hemerythrin domain-containing protein [Janthinobacterium agaricidamnosum]CDG82049.1 hemerythrin HHE cation binding domain protein [Janthinobacterium agaricidamnosum NBRC 102515 = DSM 9628]
MNTTKQTGTTASDAIALLTADHQKVRSLFRAFDDIKDDTEQSDLKAELVEQICFELTVHALVEEEIFYPAVRKAINDNALMDEAEAEHGNAKNLIKQLEEMEAGDRQLDATVNQLSQAIEHHVQEEEGDMFIRVKQTKLDTAQLGHQIQERKEAIENDFSGAPASAATSRGAPREPHPGRP